MSGKFGQIVDRPGPDGHRGGPCRLEGRLQFLDERMPCGNVRPEEESLLADDARAAETVADIHAGCLIGPVVGDDHGGAIAEGRREHAGGVMAGAWLDHQESGVAGRVQGAIQERLFFS